MRYDPTTSQLTLSASDLMNFSECGYLTWLDRERAHDRLPPDLAPTERGEDAKLIAQKGSEHELAYLWTLAAEAAADGGETFVVDAGERRDRRQELTLQAMQRGARRVVQAVLVDGPWYGIADILERVEEPCRAFGAWSYTVVDIKLARSVKPKYVLQLCLYSSMLGRLQGLEPVMAHLVLGTRAREPFVLREYAAWFDAMRAKFVATLAELPRVEGGALPDAPYPEPVSFCATCTWSGHCDGRRGSDDHLSIVANIRRDQRIKLVAAGISTVEQLAVATEEQRPPTLAEESFSRLREQAALQVEARRAQAASPDTPLAPPIRLVQPSGLGRGFAQLPEPHPHDVFFDLEGDPYILGGGSGTGKGGLEYLWGAVTVDAVDDGAWQGLLEPEPPATDPRAASQPYTTYLTGEPGADPCLPADAARTPRFHAWWAHDPRGERAAFEGFIDWLYARWEASGRQLHVFHYADYEITAIKRMMGRYATREAEVDELLRGEVFVDLLRVVRQAVRAGVPSYSIKKIEVLYRPPRLGDVTTAGSSIIDYEAWLTSIEEGRRDDGLLRGVAHYNRDDCVSTFQLRQWLLEQKARPDAPEWPHRDTGEGDDDAAAARAEDRRAVGADVETLKARLLQGVPEEAAVRSVAQQASYVLAHSIDFHRRDQKPEWWAHFERQKLGPEELVADIECIAELVLDETREPDVEKRSSIWHYTYAPQETKLRAGSTVHDAADGSRVGVLAYLDPECFRLGLKRGTAAGAPSPLALMPSTPIGMGDLIARVREVAEAWADGREDELALAGALLRAELPRTGAAPHGGRLMGACDEDPQRVTELTDRLEQSYLFVQGPPGAGKTYTGSHVIADLLARGRTVGVTGPTHKAIHNLLVEVEEVVATRGERFDGRYKCSARDETSRYRSDAGFIESSADTGTIADELAAGAVQLVAGTAFFFAKLAAGAVDCLVVDEAGQVSIANAVALTRCTRSMLLLGDPQQLPQVVKGAHPAGLERSLLEHLLGDRRTVSEECGVLLPTTRRMPPALTQFISDQFYDGRLHADPSTHGNCVIVPGSALDGAGVRRVEVVHAGRSTAAPEEADRICQLVEELVTGRVRIKDAPDRDLCHADILVVAPYNMQVNLLRERLHRDVRVGTVDKFQGQEAPVVIFSVTSSDREAVPRGLDFLLSPNRMNVALSRAKALAIVVASPALGHGRCASLEEIRLLSLLESAREAEPVAVGAATERHALT